MQKEVKELASHRTHKLRAQVLKFLFVCSALPLTQKKSDDLKISSNICFLNNTLIPAKFITPTFETIQKTAQSTNPKTLKEP